MPPDIMLPSLNCPTGLPIGTSEDFPFKNFQPNAEKIEDSLHVPGAVSNVFKNTFDWGEGTSIKARGPNVEAAAEVIATYLLHKDCQDKQALSQQVLSDINPEVPI